MIVHAAMSRSLLWPDQFRRTTGGFLGPTVVGYLNTWSGSLTAAFAFIGGCYLEAGSIFPAVKIHTATLEMTDASSGDRRVRSLLIP